MPKIKEILKWHFKPTSYKYLGEHLIDNETKYEHASSLVSLGKLIDRLPDGEKKPEKRLIQYVYNLFFDNSDAGITDQLIDSFPARKIRMLIWALDYQPNVESEVLLFSDKLKYAVQLIATNWKDSFIISFSHIYLKNINTLDSYAENKELLQRMLLFRNEEYKGTRNDILKFTSKLDFLINDEADRKYALELLEQKISLEKANEVIEQKEHVLTYEFFENVSFAYLDYIDDSKSNDQVANGFFKFLEIHNNKKVTLLHCSKVINDDSFANNQDLVKKETVRLISDPVKQRRWTHSELSVEEQQLVEKARLKFNLLLNKEFIEVFFENMVEDPRRKRYWLRFIDNIDDIIFVGNKSNYQYLKNIDSVSQYVDYRYKITTRRQDTCALIIYAKNYVFVEFTDTGALCIYKKKRFRVNLNSINGMDDLKTWSRYDYACKNSDSAGVFELWNEGRITHGGNWETRVDKWMKKFYYPSLNNSSQTLNDISREASHTFASKYY